MTDIERIKTSAAELHQIDDRHGGAQVAQVANLYIKYVEDAARRCTYGGTVQTHLYTALGQICTSAGWFAFDARHHDDARRHWDAGLRYALLARNNLLQARIWSSMSHQAWQLGHGTEAVSIARVALDQTRGRRDGQLSALLHTRVAQGHAIQNETNWSARSLLRAEKEFDKPHGGDPWLGFFNAGELASTAALCFLDLHEYPQAVKAAREALHLVQPTPFRRNHLAAHVRLGRALVGAEEWEEAVATGERALDLLPGVSSLRIIDRLERLHADLLTHGAPGAAELSERYEAMAT